VAWREEVYNVTARMDYRKGFRLTEFSGQLKQQPAGRLGQDKSKDKYTSDMTLYGEVLLGEDGLVERLKGGLNDEHHRAKATYPQGPGVTAGKGAKGFTVRVDISPQPARA